MGSTRALLLAGAMALGYASAAGAADLPPPPPAYFPPPPPPPVVFSGWYLRGDVGAGISNSPDIRSTFYDKTTGDLLSYDAAGIQSFGRDRQHMSEVGYVDVGVGYEFNDWFRMDVTGEVRSEAKFSTTEHYGLDFLPGAVPGQLGYDNYKGSVQSSVFMVNGYVTLGTWYGIAPYLMGGVGAAYHQMSALTDINPGVTVNYTDGTSGVTGLGGGGFADSRSKWELAYAGGAGFSYALSHNLLLDIGYRYLDMGSIKSGNIVCLTSCGAYERQKIHLTSNDVHVGLRWLIGDYAPPPPQFEAPIIRKY